MQAPIEIAFHNIEKSDWAEDAIRDHVARLAQVFDRLTACRVRVDVLRRRIPAGQPAWRLDGAARGPR